MIGCGLVRYIWGVFVRMDLGLMGLDGLGGFFGGIVLVRLFSCGGIGCLL